LEELREQKFDIGLTYILPCDMLIFRYLELPFMTWAAFTPYLPGTVLGYTPFQNSYALPTIGVNAKIADTFATDSLFFKMTNTVPTLILKNLIPLKYRD
jgi:hypothetical protein